MSRTQLIHALSTLAIAVVVPVAFLFVYRVWKMVADSRERRQIAKARKEYRERIDRIRLSLLPRLTPLGWKRVKLTELANLPPVNRRRIVVHLRQPLDVRKDR